MNKDNKKINQEIAVTPIDGQPETAYDMVNKYGTYEIQPTSDTDNEYPAIAQGFNKRNKIRDGRNPAKYKNDPE